MDTGATFSACNQYRYRLWRYWSAEPAVLFLMLNPSTADETVNDPTVERCQRRAKAMGAGGLQVANIFALRSTDPAALYTAADPVGQDNDAAILAAANECAQVICAWGVHGEYQGRGDAVLAMLGGAGVTPHCLGTTKAGHPRHPLYVGYAVRPMKLQVAA